MKPLAQLFKNITLIGQLGFCIVIPPLLLLYLAHLARTHWGWGTWVTVVALIVGLLAAFSSALQVVSRFFGTKKKKDDPPSCAFNDHD